MTFEVYNKEFYLLFTLTGEVNVEDMREMLAEVQRWRKETGVSDTIWDIRKVAMFSLTYKDMTELEILVASLRGEERPNIVFVTNSDLQHKMAESYIKLTAQFYTAATISSSVEDASNWLKNA